MDRNIYKGGIEEDFLTIEITEQLILHYDPDLKVSYYDWPDGRKTIILGLIIGRPENPETIHYHSGRFVSITSGYLQLDATGSMGVFYNTDKTSEPQGIICGSSTALISEIAQLELKGRDLKLAEMNWDPAPLTRLPNMKRLFIDQRINLNEGTIEVIQRSIQSINIELGSASTLLAKETLGIVMELKKIQRPIYLAMTGGSDSRFLFSALIKAEVNFESFTLLLDNVGSKIDAKIAKSICNKYGIRHQSIRPNGVNKEELKIFHAHSGRAGGDRADKYVLGNYYRSIPDDAIVLHGGCFEIGKRFYESKLKNVRFSNVEIAVNDIEKSFEKLDIKATGALKEWINHRSKYSLNNIDWIDAFYIDQRRGAWGSANRQAEDCFKFDWLIIANSWSIINILLGISVEHRRNNMVQEAAMNYLLPGISTIEPINPISLKSRLIGVVRYFIPRPIISHLKKIHCRITK